ncbi:hypothetical protein ACFVX6_17510 [Streptomyces sp. NPDC058289]|uniref:hypothetical protein n=1 Tax=Streptomyces sp. NPDC058289 TaxID=3346425 RepID=UPI0036E5EC3F
MSHPSISRRTVLMRAGVTVAAAAVSSIAVTALTPTAAYAQSTPPAPAVDDIQATVLRLKAEQARVFTGKPSPNGWEMEKLVDAGGSVWTRPVPGTQIDGVGVRLGDVETVLFHVARRFNFEIDVLRKGDITGWQAPGGVRKGLPEGNLASGTAIRIRTGHYPPGVKGGFFAHEVLVLRDVLAELEGVVRWGGDDSKTDEALFYLCVAPDDKHLPQVAAKLRSWADQPARGAGTHIDVLAPERARAARSLERTQQNHTV